MREAIEIVRAYRAAARGGSECVLATVVATRGSTYRKAGARMLMTKTEHVAGAISGGCLEGEVVRKAWWRTSEKRAALVTYDATTDDDDDVRWGFGLGCNGALDVLIERLDDADPCNPVRFVARVIEEKKRGAIATVIRGGELARAVAMNGAVVASTLSEDVAGAVHEELLAALASGDAPAVRALGSLEIAFEVVEPPLRLVVAGAGYDVAPLVAMSKELGWEVTVVEPRAGKIPSRRFPAADHAIVASPEELVLKVDLAGRCALAVLTHNRDTDLRLLRALAPLDLAYLGVLGPRKRTDAIVAELAKEGVALRTKLHAPIGLDLGGEGPEAIALSIVAEIHRELGAGSAKSYAEATLRRSRARL